MGAGAPQALGVASGAQRTERMDPHHFNPLSLDHRSAPAAPPLQFYFLIIGRVGANLCLNGCFLSEFNPVIIPLHDR